MSVRLQDLLELKVYPVILSEYVAEAQAGQSSERNLCKLFHCSKLSKERTKSSNTSYNNGFLKLRMLKVTR